VVKSEEGNRQHNLILGLAKFAQQSYHNPGLPLQPLFYGGNTMRPILAVFVLASFALLLASGINLAQDKKDAVLKGKITCNKCDLGKSAECETVIVVKDEKAKKDIVYWFDKKADKKYHGAVCSESKADTVTGTVKDEDKKKVVTVKKLEYDK